MFFFIALGVFLTAVGVISGIGTDDSIAALWLPPLSLLIVFTFVWQMLDAIKRPDEKGFVSYAFFFVFTSMVLIVPGYLTIKRAVEDDTKRLSKDRSSIAESPLKRHHNHAKRWLGVSIASLVILMVAFYQFFTVSW